MSRAQVAEAIHAVAARRARSQRSVYVAEVVATNPLKVELAENDTTLEIDEDFDLSGLLELYDRDHGIRLGDTVLLMHDDGDWTAVDVRPAEVPQSSRWTATESRMASTEDRLRRLEARVRALENPGV